jgi:hypothetical protein
VKHIKGVTCVFEEVPLFLKELTKKQAPGTQVNIRFVEICGADGEPYVHAEMQFLECEDKTSLDGFYTEGLEVSSVII